MIMYDVIRYDNVEFRVASGEWLASGSRVTRVWLASDSCVAFVWLVCGLCVACVWLVCGFCLAFVWLVLRDFPKISFFMQSINRGNI